MNSPTLGGASLSNTRLDGLEDMLRQIRWQFFFTLTFSRHAITEKRAVACFNGFKGKLLKNSLRMTLRRGKMSSLSFRLSSENLANTSIYMECSQDFQKESLTLKSEKFGRTAYMREEKLKSQHTTRNETAFRMS